MSYGDVLSIIEENLGSEVVTALIEFSKDEIKSYDGSIVALRSDVQDVLGNMDKLIDMVKDTPRLNRLKIIDALNGMHKVLYNSEGY